MVAMETGIPSTTFPLSIIPDLNLGEIATSQVFYVTKEEPIAQPNIWAIVMIRCFLKGTVYIQEQIHQFSNLQQAFK